MLLLCISSYGDLIESSKRAHPMSLVAHEFIWMIFNILSNSKKIDMTNLVHWGEQWCINSWNVIWIPIKELEVSSTSDWYILILERYCYMSCKFLISWHNFPTIKERQTNSKRMTWNFEYELVSLQKNDMKFWIWVNVLEG